MVAGSPIAGTAGLCLYFGSRRFVTTENVSGKWVMVVQRVPVRLEVESMADALPLRVNVTVVVSIGAQFERLLALNF